MSEVEDIIAEYMPLVKSIASKFKVSNLGIDYDDLVSIGTMGLMDAHNKYSDDKGSKFSTYATIRIKSYIIDEIRRLSPITRTDMDKIKKYTNCLDTLGTKLQRNPKSTEVATELGITQKDINNIENSLSILNTVSMDSLIENEDNNVLTLKDILEGGALTPSNIIEEEEKIHMLMECIKQLDEREQIILSLYYFDELTLKEVGMVLNLSESRVCILHNKILKKLKVLIDKSNYSYTERYVK